jgi:hypothetical protein
MVTAPTDFEYDYCAQTLVGEHELNRNFIGRNLLTTYLRHLSLSYLASAYRDAQSDRHGRLTY